MDNSWRGLHSHAVYVFLRAEVTGKKSQCEIPVRVSEEAKRIINESIKAAESKKREALVEAREEIHKSRNEYEREVKERRAELSKQERRLQQKEETLDRKTDTLEKKTEALNQKIAQAEAQQEEIKLVKKSQFDMLEKISDFTVDQAKEYLLNNLESELTHEKAVKIREVEAADQEEARKSRPGDHRPGHPALRSGPRQREPPSAWCPCPTTR